MLLLLYYILLVLRVRHLHNPGPILANYAFQVVALRAQRVHVDHVEVPLVQVLVAVVHLDVGVVRKVVELGVPHVERAPLDRFDVVGKLAQFGEVAHRVRAVHEGGDVALQLLGFLRAQVVGSLRPAPVFLRGAII